LGGKGLLGRGLAALQPFWFLKKDISKFNFHSNESLALAEKKGGKKGRQQCYPCRKVIFLVVQGGGL